MRFNPARLLSPTAQFQRRIEIAEEQRKKDVESLSLAKAEQRAIRSLAGTEGGRVWIDRWQKEINEAVRGLISASPNDTARIVALQTRIRDREAWLRILTGESKENQNAG